MSNSTDEKATTETSSSHSAKAEGAAPEAQISEKVVLHEISTEEEVAVTMTMTTMADPPTILPIDPSPSPSAASGLRLPSSPPARKHVDDGGASLAARSERGSIADNASKSSSSIRAKARSPSNNVATGGTSNSRGKRVINGTIYEEEGDLPSLSGGRRNCEPPDANTSSFRQQHQYRQQRNPTASDPPEYGYRKKVNHHTAASTGIHNIQMNSRGHVYLDGEDSVANSSDGPPGNRLSNNQDVDDIETRSTHSPPPPSDYFNQPSQRQMYPAEPRGGMVDIVSGNFEESSFVGSSEATSLASNTTRSSDAVNQRHGGGSGGGGSGEYYNDPSSALNRHLSRRSNGTNRSNGHGRKKMDPQDYTETIKKQDPSDQYSTRQTSHRAHNFDATESDDEMEGLIGRQQQRVVYASSAKRDLYNHNRTADHQDKAKDSDLESGRASYQQNQQRVRFAEKMFSSRGNTSSSSSHQVVVGNAHSSSASGSAYGLSWMDRSISSDSSVISKSSIDSQSSNSNSSFSNRNKNSSKGSHSGGGIGRKVVSLIGNCLWNIFEGLHPTPSVPSSNYSTSSGSSISIDSGSDSGGGGGTNSNKRTRFQYLKRNTAILAMLSLMMLATIGSYYEAFFGVPNNDYNDDSTRGLGIEHDMRPPAMGLMDNIPHHVMLKGSVGSGVNSNGAGNDIMDGGSGVLPPLVENGQVVDWDKVPPHLRGYYSKVFGVQAGANAAQQQQQQQAMMQNAQQAQVQPDDPNAAGQAIQSIGNEAIGAVDSFKIPTLEQHEFQEHIQEIEGAIPFLGQQQQEQMQQEQEEQLQQQQQQQQEQEQEQLMQQQDEEVAKELEQVHLRQQAEAEQQRAQAEAEQQQQQQQEQQEQEQQSQEMNAANEERMEREEEERRKQAEEEALRKAGITDEGAKQENMNEETIERQGDESEAATNEGSALDEVNSEAENADPAPESAVAAEGGQTEAEVDNNAALESLQWELSELMDMVKQRNSDTG